MNNYIQLLIILAGMIVLPVKNLQAQSRPDVILNIVASTQFIKSVDQQQQIVAETELITSANPVINQRYPINFKGNKIQLRIQSRSDYVYLRITLGLNQWPYSLLVIPGDTLQLNIQDSLRYTLHSTHQVLTDLQLALDQAIVLNQGIQKGDDPDVLISLAGRRDRILQHIDSMISASQGKIPQVQLNILAANAKGQLGVSYVGNLSALAIYAGGVSTTVRALARTQAEKLYAQNLALADTLTVRHSIWYGSYLFKLEQMFAGLQSNPAQFKHERFGKIFTAITENYRGLLREKVLTTFFLGSLAESDQFQPLLAEALKTIKDPVYLQILTQMQSGKTGNPAYPFQLESESGKFYSLSDFKGKVLICKFWFKGCSGCITLHQEMKPILEKFKSNPDVVFLSINVDLDKKSWKMGLDAGKCTSKEYLNLYVGTQGRFNPMIVYYNYESFPKLLIIDKAGKIINAATERPGTALQREKLEKLIQSHL